MFIYVIISGIVPNVLNILTLFRVLYFRLFELMRPEKRGVRDSVLGVYFPVTLGVYVETLDTEFSFTSEELSISSLVLNRSCRKIELRK